MTIRQDHEQVVAAAREDMAKFDARQALERWLQNYLAPDVTIPANEWCVVTKAGKGWKVERGLLDSDTPYQTAYTDAHAPAPPVMEVRPPKPEPVPPRFQVPEPPRVGSHEWLSTHLQSRIEAAFTSALTSGHVPEEIHPLTAAKVIDLHRRYGQYVTMPILPREVTHFALEPVKETTFRYLTLNWGAVVRTSDRVILCGVDPGRPSGDKLKRPPPESSVRNK